MSIARSVAKEIVDAQTTEYSVSKEGSKDVMSILSGLVQYHTSRLLTRFAVRANLSENPKTRLSDDSLMAQMTCVIQYVYSQISYR